MAIRRFPFGGSVCLIVLSCLALFSITLTSASFAQSARTDLNLVIAIDCSWSVNRLEYDLQLEGISAAFRDPEVIAAITNGRRGAIAVTLTQWSNAKSQHTVVPWTRIANGADAYFVAQQSRALSRLPKRAGTSISSALRHAQNALDGAPFTGDRHVIDIITDGVNNGGGAVSPVRDLLVDQGTTINGLAIINEKRSLKYYLEIQVIGGVGAFAERANSYEEFAAAFKRKLLREIRGDEVTMKRKDSAVDDG